MPILPHFSRRRLCLVGFLIVTAAFGAALLVGAPGAGDAARGKYDRIQEGMTKDEVETILKGWQPWLQIRSSWRSTDVWIDASTGARITLQYDDERLTRKQFEEGDQSFRARVARLKARLADKLPHVP